MAAIDVLNVADNESCFEDSVSSEERTDEYTEDAVRRTPSGGSTQVEKGMALLEDCETLSELLVLLSSHRAATKGALRRLVAVLQGDSAGEVDTDTAVASSPRTALPDKETGAQPLSVSSVQTAPGADTATRDGLKGSVGVEFSDLGLSAVPRHSNETEDEADKSSSEEEESGDESDESSAFDLDVDNDATDELHRLMEEIHIEDVDREGGVGDNHWQLIRPAARDSMAAIRRVHLGMLEPIDEDSNEDESSEGIVRQESQSDASDSSVERLWENVQEAGGAVPNAAASNFSGSGAAPSGSSSLVEAAGVAKQERVLASTAAAAAARRRTAEEEDDSDEEW
eukprot:TRINITY_DN26413_c0_g1_i1.p1 TRINITY_DN26413_c0_g1~~TRINITY_DN26413_c0_g1_i1.p1  ORF type:complete len:341 (+),score=94.35 TRINITY_DN26413_c0_g1_i1:73-1095(+)